jgi:hypothetical protein
VYTRTESPTQELPGRPSNRIESIKTAIQWTFLVDTDWATSMALGYINELEFNDLDAIRNGPFFTGNVFNPFFVAAKRWGESFHSLLYTGPFVAMHFKDASLVAEWQANLSLHYMIPETRNFIGVETNASFSATRSFAHVRPQMRLSIIRLWDWA